MSTYCQSETGAYFITELIKVTSYKEINVAAKEVEESPGFRYCARRDETGNPSYYRKSTRICNDSEVPQAQSYVEAKEREYLQELSSLPRWEGTLGDGEVSRLPRWAWTMGDGDRLPTRNELQDRFEAKIRKQSRCNHENLNKKPCDWKHCGVLVRTWLELGHKHACNRGFYSSYRSTCQDCDFSWEEPRAQTCDRHAN